MTRQVTDNLYIDLEYFTPEEYYTYEALAEAVFDTAATFVCLTTAGSIKEFDAAFTVSATQDVTATRIKEFDANFTGVFSPVMMVIAIRNLGSSMNVVATMSTDVERNRAVDITLDSIANLAAQSARTRETTAGFDATSNLNADFLVVQLAQAALSSTFTQTTNANSFYTFRTPKNLVISDNGSGGIGVTNPVINTTNKKYGAGSVYFAGNSDTGTGYKTVCLLPTGDQRFFTTSTVSNGAWTIEGWFRFDSMGTFTAGNSSDHVPVMANGHWSTDLGTGAQTLGSGFVIFKQANANTLTLNYKNGTSLLSGTIGSFSANTFYHIAVQLDSSDNFTVYFNGNRVYNAAGINNFTDSGFYLGNNDTWGPVTLSGSNYVKVNRGRNNPSMYVDDLRVTVGSAIYSGTTYTPPTAALPVQGYNTLGKYPFDENFNDYVGQVLFTSSLISTASLTATGIVPKTLEAAAALSSTVSLTATIGLLNNFTAELPVIATQLSAVGRVGQALVACDVVANLSASAEVTKGIDAAFVSEFTQTAIVSNIKQFDIDLTTTATVSVDAVSGKLAEANLDSTVSLTASAERSRDIDSDLSAAVTLSAQITVNLEAQSALISTVTLTSDASRTRPFEAALPVIATQLSAVGKVGDTLAAFDVTASLSASVIAGKIVIADLSSTVTLSADANRTRDLDSAVSSDSNLIVSGVVVKEVNCNVSITFTQTAAGTAIKRAESVQSSAFTLFTTLSGLQQSQAALSAQASQSTSAVATRSGQANLPVIASQLTAATETNSFTANLSSTFTLQCQTIEIRIDPDLTYKIPRESRSYMIIEELRVEKIIPELRSYII